MDAHTLQVLEFPKLLAYLSRFAVSEAGAAACLNLQPVSSIEEIRFQHLFFEQGRLWLDITGFKPAAFPRLDGALAFLERSGQSLDLDGLWIFRQALGQVENLVSSVLTGWACHGNEAVISANAAPEQGTQPPWPVLLEFCRARPLPQKSSSALGRCFSDDGALRDEASPELALARGEIRRIHQQCGHRAGEFIRRYNLAHYVREEYITLASDRYVIPLISNFKGRFQGVVHDYSQTGDTCYFEPMFLVELNNRLQEFKRAEREEERKICLYLSDLLRAEKPQLDDACALLVEMDMLQARHKLGQALDGVLVRLDEGLPVNLREARHPLLILSRDTQGDAPRQPTPVDILLEKGQKALIVSGGNAGGKTVCLKTLGLISLMTMCALPTPVAPGSTLPLWRHIMPFIGDDQSLEDHVSTFTAQIRQLAANWDKFGPEALVILDEFGAGTDPSQGAALAQAVLDELMDKGAFIFAATHFPALKVYALSKIGVRAASVLFDPESKKPLFRLIYDQVGASQALEVAAEYGLPEAVLKKARAYLLMEGEDADRLLDRLNMLAAEREKEIYALKNETEACLRRREVLEGRFASDKEKLFSEIREQAQQVLREWKSARVSHKQTLKNLSRLRAAIPRDKGPEATEENSLGRPVLDRLLPGEALLYIPWNKAGKVLETDKARGRVRLDLSGVSMWVDVENLACPQRKTGFKSATGGLGLSSIAPAGFLPRLDLRGRRVEEALSELGALIDSAVLKGSERLEVLHGRGTGALRREIHAYIKRHPQVESFDLANEEQGGDGVTLIFLK
ncbi:MAG: Smr/MutS family protein [Deltaproteobacteria bacterium]|jgi:DNA mismatch repair protein MutS2|nr:Smr/MutS family protein [Deltaproteobacteria bacterium]